MKMPETYQEYLIWLGMQFPVLAAVLLAGRWIVRFLTNVQERHKVDLQQGHTETMAERERVIESRDATIREQASRIRSLDREVRRLRRGQR